ncbi:MAG: winged helix-turn-helix transcriptional regulator [Candidatus Bathyarchaeota archaeon]|nr:winged helix-turn-helix transcriptional regulator [Candidatus Bathyarchaeota archaeon]
MNELDDLDFKIIHEIRKDPRISVTDLSKNVQSSRPTVMTRMNRLRDEGFIDIIGGLDVSKMEYKTALIAIEVKKRAKLMEIEGYLMKCPKVQALYRTTGQSNLQAFIWGEDDDKLGSIVNCIREFPDAEIKEVRFLGVPVHGRFVVDVTTVFDDHTQCKDECLQCPGYTKGVCQGCPKQGGS